MTNNEHRKYTVLRLKKIAIDWEGLVIIFVIAIAKKLLKLFKKLEK